jgi:hypothetical protein
MVLLAQLIAVSYAASLPTLWGVEGKCGDLFCTTMSLNLIEYHRNRLAHKLSNKVVPVMDRKSLMSRKRFSAFDSSSGMYFLALQDNAEGSFYNVFLIRPGADTVDIFALNITTKVSTPGFALTIPQGLPNMNGLEFDSHTNELYGLFNNVLTSIDSNGTVNVLGKMFPDTSSSHLVALKTSIDSAGRRIFMVIHDVSKAQYVIGTYNIDTKAFSLSAPVKHRILEILTPYEIQFNSKTNEVVTACDTSMGPQLYNLDTASGEWKEVKTITDFSQNYDIIPNWKYYGSLTYLDVENQIFYITLMTSDDAQTEMLVSVDLKKGYFDQSNYSGDATNYFMVY